MALSPRGSAAAALFFMVAVVAPSASARPAPGGNDRVLFSPPSPGEPTLEQMLPGGISGLSSTIYVDTVEYGGTIWAPDSNRWEAVRDGEWTFDTGYASSTTGAGKPAGYHYLMDGWYGLDETAVILATFRRVFSADDGHGGILEICPVIAGNASMWAGVTLSEANVLCYAAGRGYGNNWDVTLGKTFAYDGGGGAQLQFLYHTEAEENFDYLDVYIDTTGDGSAADILLWSFTGATPTYGTAAINLTAAGHTLPSAAGNVVIKFNANSDGGYSDEDGLNPTNCGHTSLDNVTLSGGITGYSGFETGTDGWEVLAPAAVGDFADIKHGLSDLGGTYGTFCACDIQDSVLVLADPMGGHPLDQDNSAVSPWIDLKRGGDVGKPTKLIIYSTFADLPLTNYVFYDFLSRYYPAVCSATGLLYRTRWESNNYWIDFPTLMCNAIGTRYIRNITGIVGSSAEQVQIKVNVLNLCRTAPFGLDCTGMTNSTPWFDNIALGVAGSAVAPAIYASTFDVLQDNFAADGTLNPASTAHLDTNRLKGTSTPVPGSILADTMVVGGDGGNTEVRVVFHVHGGPFISAPALAAWAAARWTPEPAIGSGWYSARMDTTEQGGSKNSGKWMSTLNEEDPHFLGVNGSRNDRLADPLNPNQLNADIFPDNILTPGSRVDYFFESRYMPPDPRNPGGTYWYLLPDTTGGRTFEAEILPASMQADTSWNCVLYVDGHHDRNPGEQRQLESALTARLGGGGSTPEGTRYDRWDVQSPSSGQLFLGRPLNSDFGCSASQIFAYKAIVWAASTLGPDQITAENADILIPWLQLQSTAGNRFWISGDDVATGVVSRGQTSAIQFMQDVCGVLRTCNTIRKANCPAGAALDSTYCIPLPLVTGAAFNTLVPASGRGNGCPELRSFDLLGVNPAVPTAHGQLTYTRTGIGAGNFASVTNYVSTVSPPLEYKTVWDGVAVGVLRTSPADPHNRTECSDLGALYDRVSTILNWFSNPEPFDLCRPMAASAVPPIEVVPPARPSLGPAFPNPLQRGTQIRVVSSDGHARLRLEILDVTGRLVRTVLNDPLAVGPHDIAWDGRTDDGHAVASGMYFYRLSGPGISEARKLVVVR